MKRFIRPIKLGNLILPNNIFYAPLAGCSDFPFRKMTSRFSPGLLFTEMVKMDALIRNDRGTFRLLDFSHEMHPIGAQICGSCPKKAKAASKMIEEMGFDTVDLNCGCPVDKVTRDKSGSALLQDVQLIGDILSNMVASVSIPVTVKIRAGWDENSLVAKELVQIAEKAGAKAITIHARTRKQGYQGSAHWPWIKECKEAAKEIIVVGNGDVFTKEAALRMFEETGVDAVLIARGTLGQPWIAEDIKAEASSLLEEKKSSLLLEHFEELLRYHPKEQVIIDMRKIGCWYVKKSEGTRAFRSKMSRVTSLEEIKELIFQEEDTSFSSIPLEVLS